LFTRPVALAVREVAENAIAEHELARDTVYRVDLEGYKRAERVELPFDLEVPGRELLVLIDNEDSQPLQITLGARNAATGPRGVPGAASRRLSGDHGQSALRGSTLRSYPGCAARSPAAPGVPVASLSLSALTANPSYRPAEPLPEIQDLGTVLDTASGAVGNLSNWRERVSSNWNWIWTCWRMPAKRCGICGWCATANNDRTFWNILRSHESWSRWCPPPTIRKSPRSAVGE